MAAARTLAVAVILVTVSGMGALAGTSGDAGTGEDAPDSRANALALEPGAYQGNLSPDDDNLFDEDWYEVRGDGDGAACTEARFNTGGPAFAHLVDPAVDGSHMNATVGTEAKTLALVGPSTGGTLAGLGDANASTITSYDVSFDVTKFNDNNHGQDEPAAGETTKITNGCFGGTLSSDDGRDVWEFYTDGTEVAVLSFASAGDRADRLVLESPNGTTVTNLTASDGVDIDRVDLDVAGNWTLMAETPDTASSSAEIPYSASLSSDIDLDCRPRC